MNRHPIRAQAGGVFRRGPYERRADALPALLRHDEGAVLPVGLVHGVVTHKFSVDLSGSGRVFGVKFRPGGFGAFTGADVGAWTDRILPLTLALGDTADDLVARVLDESGDEARAAVVDEVLRGRLPDRDPRYEDVLAIVEELGHDPAGLAVGLGWFDQAHFTREFTALVGQTPAAYAARRER